MNIIKLVEKKRTEILAITSKYQASNVRIFGSFARNEADQQSDLDILVHLNTNKTGFAYFRLLDGIQDELHSLLGIKVDVIDENGLKPKIKSRIMKEAISL
jgi:uncharacterized protein